MKLLRYLAIALLFNQAYAQTATTIRDEYAQTLKAAGTTTALGPELFGDSVNLKDGVTSFSATDVSAKTNGGLPLAVTRTLGINARDIDKYVDNPADGEMFGNWKLDVPVIHGTFDERTGWVVNSATPTLRCSSGSAPPGVKSAFSNWNLTYLPEQYWHGNEISIPGKGSSPMLVLLAGRPRPTDGKAYSHTTKDDWRVSCVPALKNGPGEGFRVALPDGTKYTFDWMSSRKVAALKDTQCKVAFYNEYNVVNWSYVYWQPDYHSGPIDPDPNGHWRLNRMDGGSLSGASRQVNFCQEQVVVNRREYFLHATKVEDRFGNQVVYDYDPANPRRLRSITSSDGNAITLGYDASGKINAVTHNGRTWRYQYDAVDGTTLSAVVQPDGSRWTFGYDNLYTMLHYDNQHIIWLDCEPSVPGQATASVTIGHPSGATGVFSFRSMMHGIDRIPGGCYQPDPDKPTFNLLSDNVMVYKAASLTSKQITGPGLPAQTWTYNYFPSWSWNPNGYMDDCTGAVCDSTVRTEVTAPDGTVTRSTFGNDYFRSAGQLLKVESLRDGVAVQTIINNYMANTTGQPFPDRVGADPNPRNNSFVTEKIRPLLSTVTMRDGDQFSRSTLTFDAFARPVRVVKSNSLGASREEVTEYDDNLNLWVLGQVRRQYVPLASTNGRAAAGNVVVAETEYDAQAMPWKIYAYGKLQQVFTYDAQGKLSAVADGNNNITRFADYYRGVPRKIVFPATDEAPTGATLSATVDANGWILSTTNETGSRTCYGYDAMGRTTSIVYPSETQAGVCDASRWASATMGFEPVASDEHGLPAGHWRSHRHEGNKRTTTYFDALWRPVLEESLDAADAAGTLTQTVSRYDAMGRRSFASFPQRGVGSFLDVVPGTRTSYDALGRPVRVEQDSELGVLATTTEYLGGLRKRITNPRGLSATIEHLAWDVPRYDLPTSSVMPENKITEIRRHPQFGWPLRLAQRSADYTQQQVRSYVYDGNAQLCKTIESEAGATVIGYDAAGNPAWSASGLDPASFGDNTNCNHAEAWASGRRTTRGYDARNRLTSLNFPDTRGSQTWTYFADGLPAKTVTTNEAGGAAAVTAAYAYNKRRLLTSESLGQPGWYDWSIGYGYDAIGNLASHTYPTGLVVDYAPNALGQATKAGSYASNLQYFPDGSLQQFVYGNGVAHSVTHNVRQLPERISDVGVSDYAYTYDANANVTGISDLARGADYERALGYDNLDRLTSAISASFGGDHRHRFTYDALDNLKSWKLGGVKDYADYAYDARTHRLARITDSLGNPLFTFAYDEQGNVSAKNGQAYEFDFGNRLRQVRGIEAYRYDGLGRRVQSTRSDGRQTLWMYGGGGKMLFSWEGPTNQKTHEYVYLAGKLIATVDHDWPGNTAITTKYHHTDALGSPVAVTDAAGHVVERNDYEPYGAVIGKPAYAGVGFGGHFADGETGLTYMQQRYYDATVGRFLSTDPLSALTGGPRFFNRYAYAFSNPYRYQDKNGAESTFVGSGDDQVENCGGPCSPVVTSTRTLANGVTETYIDAIFGAAREGEVLGEIKVYAPGKGPVIEQSHPDGMLGRIRNPRMGEMSPLQADYYSKQRVHREFMIVMEPVRIGFCAALSKCGAAMVQSIVSLKTLGRPGGRGMTLLKGAGTATAVIDHVRYLQDLMKPIQVGTDAEILEERENSSALWEWYGIGKDLLGITTKITGELKADE